MPGVDALASVLNGANAPYMADMYARWVSNPASVDSSFGELFALLNDEARGVIEDASGASWAPRHFDDRRARPGQARPPRPPPRRPPAPARNKSGPPPSTACAPSC